MRVFIRTDASSSIGHGHVMRCLTLAERMAQHGALVTFACREHDGHLIDLIEHKGFSVARLPQASHRVGLSGYAAWLGVSQLEDADQTLQAMSGESPDWLVVDHYALDAAWETGMRRHVGRLLVIDDLANRHHDCDVLLDQNLVADFEHRYGDLVTSEAIRLLGPEYALLQPEYARLSAEKIAAGDAVPRVLIFMGGADRGTTLKAVQGLLALDRKDVACDIVIADPHPDRPAIERLVVDLPLFKVHASLPTLAPLMAKATLAVGAGGATSWERLCMGLRSVVVILADNQRAIAEELARRDLVTIVGEAAIVASDDFRHALDKELGRDTPRLSTGIVDGRGTERVAAVIGVNACTVPVLRTARAADEDLLLKWANDALVRSNAFDSHLITPEEHHRFFTARLADHERCLFLVAETESGVPLGQVRFDRRGDIWVISYSVAPQFRGRGLGKAILQEAIKLMQPGTIVVGEVLAENLASHRVFRSLGFESMPGRPGATRYEIYL